MSVFQALRDLDLSIFDFIELPSYMSDQHKIIFLMINKTAKKAGLRRRQ